MRKALLTSVAVGMLAFAHGAGAQTITSPTTLNLINFGTGTGGGYITNVIPAAGGETFAAAGPLTGLYSGSVSAGNGASALSVFSTNQDYLAVQPTGTITITFATPQTSFGLLWGSIDSYNNLTFLAGGTMITGTQIVNALGGSATKNVLISGLAPFTSVVAADNTSSAFEFDPAVAQTSVPEPISLALLGSGVVAAGLVRRRKSGGLAA